MQSPGEQDYWTDDASEDALPTSRILAFLILIALLALAPLPEAQQSAIALIQLELLATLLIVVSLWTPRPRFLSAPEIAATVLVLFLPLAYLVPLPASLAELLPSRQPYQTSIILLPESTEESKTIVSDPATEAPALSIGRFFGVDESQVPAGLRNAIERVSEAFARLGAVNDPPGVSASVIPYRTLSAWLFLLPPLAVFMAVRGARGAQLRKLLTLVVVVAAAEAAFGLAQVFTSGGMLASIPEAAPRATGTYRDPNHLAGLLGLVTPAVAALFVISFGAKPATQQAVEWTPPDAFGVRPNYRALVYGALLVLLITGLVFSRSRAGILLLIVGVVLGTMIFLRRAEDAELAGSQTKVLAIALSASLVAGLAAVLERFSATDAVAAVRPELWAGTIEGIRAFFPVGSGPGTYPEVFPIFLPAELGAWSGTHAHNGYLELLFEGGAAAAAILLYLLWLFVRQWVRLFRVGQWTDFQFIQAGSGLGLVLLLLHELVEFNLRIPANAVYFAFFAGLFFHRIDQEPSSPAASEPWPENVTPPPISQPPARNPFLD